MKHIFMVNRFSLKDRLDSYVEKIDSAAKELKLDYKIEINDDNNSTEDILKKYKRSEHIIYAVGGDGILNRVVNAIVGTKNKLGCIPAGTGNDFNRSIVEAFDEGDNQVDLIKCNNMYFINVACFGVDSDIANDDSIVHNKFIPRSQQYNVGVAKHIILFKPYNYKMKWDKESAESKLAAITVCNGRYYGGGFHVNPDGVYDDGKMDIYLIHATNRRKLIKYLLKLLKGKQETLEIVEHIKTEKFTVTCEKDSDGNLDGEKLTSKEFEMRVIPKAITVYYNKQLIDLINSK
jgi:YegS/Rv2252/BmrU family lipid kinase